MVRGGQRKVKLEPSMWLTQFGERLPGDPPRDSLRADMGETDMSMILGRKSPEEASLIVRKFASNLADARYVQVGTLESKGFIVEHTPKKFNPDHVSVYAPRGLDGQPGEWDDEVAKLFRACFDAPVGDREDVADDQQA